MNLMEILKTVVEKDASDVYITAESPPAYRLDGKTSPTGEMLTAEDTERLAFEAMNEKQKGEFLSDKEMNLALSYPELGRFRVNIFYQRNCVGMVIRLIKIDIQTLDDLGLPEILKPIIMTKMGLVLVVGATGSGKSTTLAAMIDHRNSNSAGHIITVEDPVEFVHPHKRSIVTQREVGVDTFSFAAALKNALRQAPDVILVGEIRDTETMEAAITFAETGHLCLATLHANNANQSLERIINFFPPERHAQIYLLLSLNLKSIISQRLIPTVDGKRVAALEILLDSPRIKDLIYKGEIGLMKDTMKASENEGMITFDQAIYNSYKEGKVDLETALKHADSANDLRLKIKFDSAGDQKEEVQAAPSFKLRSNESNESNEE